MLLSTVTLREITLGREEARPHAPSFERSLFQVLLFALVFDPQRLSLHIFCRPSHPPNPFSLYPSGQLHELLSVRSTTDTSDMRGDAGPSKGTDTQRTSGRYPDNRRTPPTPWCCSHYHRRGGTQGWFTENLTAVSKVNLHHLGDPRLIISFPTT